MPEHGARGGSRRRVADAVAAVVLWAGVGVLAVVSGFRSLWLVAWSGTFSSPSCTGQPDLCAEQQARMHLDLLLLGAFGAPVLALLATVVVWVAGRRSSRRGTGRRGVPLFVWPALAVLVQAGCLWWALG
ncbi:hypothetical protein [Nocardia sp. NPDC003345]